MHNQRNETHTAEEQTTVYYNRRYCAGACITVQDFISFTRTAF